MKKYFTAFCISLLLSKAVYSDKQSPSHKRKLISRSAKNDQTQPVKIVADLVVYDDLLQLVKATMNVKIYYLNYELTADYLVYDIQRDTVQAYGNVVAKSDKDIVAHGDYIELQSKFKDAIVKNLLLQLPKDVKVSALSAFKRGENFTALNNATYTACPVCEFNNPQWQFDARRTAIDLTSQTVVYRHVFFKIYGIPVFYSPYLSHPTPDADAKSGILRPEIQGNSIKIPLYLRLKSNIDMTITPRILPKKIIYEGEFRHKINVGSYEISGSMLRDTYPQNNKNKDLKLNSNAYQYYIQAKGNFSNFEHYYYGFLFERTSDKSYMKNYDYAANSYLTSKLHFDNIERYSYYNIEIVKFQGLRQQDTHGTDANILPHMFYKYFIPFNDKKLNIDVETDFFIYRQPNNSNINRAILKVVTTRNLINHNNHLINASLYLRTDLYSNSSLQNEFGDNVFAKNSPAVHRNINKSFLIPEQHTAWRYQALQTTDFGYLECEPQMLLVLSGHHDKSKNNLINTDSQIIELRDDNLFRNNRYGGVDRHEAGSKLSYGVRITLFDNDSQVKNSLFLGQLYRLSSDYNAIDKQSGFSDKKSNIVGRLTTSIDNNELYYRFSKAPTNFATEADEVGYSTKIKTVDATISYAAIRNYSYKETAHYIRQINLNINYNFSKKLQLGYFARRNLSSNSVKKFMDYGISVTYTGDCVKITGKFINNFTSDSSRGIKKKNFPSFVVDLRTISY